MTGPMPLASLVALFVGGKAPEAMRVSETIAGTDRGNQQTEVEVTLAFDFAFEDGREVAELGVESPATTRRER